MMDMKVVGEYLLNFVDQSLKQTRIILRRYIADNELRTNLKDTVKKQKRK